MTETAIRRPDVPPVHMRRVEFDPAPDLARMRETGVPTRVRTAFGVDAWLVTRAEDVRQVLSDPQLFSNGWQAFRFVGADEEITEAERARMRAGNLLAFDPPEHTRLRRMLTPEFTIRRMRRLEPRVREIVDARLDAMAQVGPPADLVTDFALPIPSLVICELLGVPYSDRAGFQQRARRLLDISIPMKERLAASRESRAYMTELVRRKQADPGDDLLGMLVREHGGDLTEDELIGIAGLLLVAGHETTSNMLGLGTLALLRHPEQLAAVRDDPEAVGPAVEELLRWLSIVHSGTVKTTTADVVLGGMSIGAGEVVMCSLPAANRDPAVIDRPDELDVRRGAPGHLAFGHGIHHCLGAPLARMEMRIGFPALLRRFPTLREVPGGAEFRSFSVIYGLTTLPVTW